MQDAPQLQPRSNDILVEDPYRLAKEIADEHQRARQEAAVREFVDITNPQSLNDFETYLNKRPVQSEAVTPDGIEKQLGTQSPYESLSLTELAKEKAEAEVSNDRTKSNDIDEILQNKVKSYLQDVRISGRSDVTSKRTRSAKALPENDRQTAAGNLSARLNEIKDKEKARLLGTPEEKHVDTPKAEVTAKKERASEEQPEPLVAETVVDKAEEQKSPVEPEKTPDEREEELINQLQDGFSKFLEDKIARKEYRLKPETQDAIIELSRLIFDRLAKASGGKPDLEKIKEELTSTRDRILSRPIDEEKAETEGREAAEPQEADENKDEFTAKIEDLSDKYIENLNAIRTRKAGKKQREKQIETYKKSPYSADIWKGISEVIGQKVEAEKLKNPELSDEQMDDMTKKIFQEVVNDVNAKVSRTTEQVHAGNLHKKIGKNVVAWVKETTPFKYAGLLREEHKEKSVNNSKNSPKAETPYVTRSGHKPQLNKEQSMNTVSLQDVEEDPKDVARQQDDVQYSTKVKFNDKNKIEEFSRSKTRNGGIEDQDHKIFNAEKDPVAADAVKDDLEAFKNGESVKVRMGDGTWQEWVVEGNVRVGNRFRKIVSPKDNPENSIPVLLTVEDLKSWQKEAAEAEKLKEDES